MTFCRFLYSITNSMSSPSTSQLDAFSVSKEVVDQLKDELINQIWLAIFWVVLIAVPLSVSRATMTGWKIGYTIQIIALLVIAIFIGKRESFSTCSKVAGLVISFAGLGVWGLVHFGVLGFGIWFFVISVVIVGAIYSTRMAMMLFGVMTLCILGAMLGHTTGVIQPSFDVSQYANSWMPWSMMLVTATVLPALLLVCFRAYQKTVMSLMYNLENQRDQIAQTAYFDELTKLPTRTLAHDRLNVALSRARRNDRLVAVCFLDLDRFKDVNDTYGHKAGDHVLINVSQRLAANIRADDTVARLGGDEFLLVLNDIKSREDVEPILENVREVIASPIDYDGVQLSVGVSVGVAFFPDDGEALEVLIEHADSSMYTVKRHSRRLNAVSGIPSVNDVSLTSG